MRRLLWVPLCAALAACPPSVDTGDDGTGPIVVGPEGKVAVRGGATINIPKNAVTSETVITVTLVDQDCSSQISDLTCVPVVADRSRISVGYRFSPTTLVFQQPVKIWVPYLEDRLPAPGIDRATYDLRRGDSDDPYLELPSPVTRTDFPVVEATTQKLGLFWATSPQKPAVSELALTPQNATLQVGDTQQFAARVTDPAGNEVPDARVQWSIVPARVAKVNSAGLVEALAPGTATLTATSGEAQMQAAVYVVGTTAGPRTFRYENPLPTGNDLYGGGVANGHAYFVGSNATVITRDPQDAWKRLYSSPGLTLKAAAGAFPSSAVAVGTSGQVGVLVDVKDPGPPVLKTYQTVLPGAVWFDGAHGMAVGSGNDVLLFRSGAWDLQYSPSFETLLDVVGDGAGGFVTVGDRGSIYQYDAATQTWDSLFDTQLSALLVDAVIADPAASEAWGVGANKLWHFQQNAWTALNLPASPAVEALTAVGMLDGKIVVGGRASKQGYLFVFTPDAQGGTWTSVKLRGPQLIRSVFGDAQNGYAVGDYGAVWQYANGTFVELSSGFYGDVADVSAAPGIAVAAVNECGDGACSYRQGKVYARDESGAWTELGFQMFSEELTAIAAKSPTEVWAAGDGGSMWRFDGQSWAAFFPSTLAIRDLAFCGDDLWAVGDRSTVYTGNNLAVLPVGNGNDFPDFKAVSCQGANEVWIAGDYVLFRNGARVGDPSVNPARWRAVWTPAANEAYAFGDANYGVYWNTRAMLTYRNPGNLLPEVVPALWGSSVDNLYAVAYTAVPFTFGYALRFDGAQWALVDSGASRRPTSISGSSATEVFIGTEGGGLLKGVAP